jgi:hypothetical protein
MFSVVSGAALAGSTEPRVRAVVAKPATIAKTLFLFESALIEFLLVFG